MTTTKLAMILLVIGAVAVLAIPQASVDPVKLETLREQVVLYTVHHGDPRTLPEAIEALYKLAKDENIPPKGPLALVALNDPFALFNRKHRLTEIRIPVDPNAADLEISFDEMTGIKILPTRTVAWTKKTRRYGRRECYRRLYEWTKYAQYVPAFGVQEVFTEGYDPDKLEEMEIEISVGLFEVSGPIGK